MKTVWILKGLPGSGKSTLAKKMLAENPGNIKRLNKDELRSMLDNSYHTTANEKFVERLRDLMLIEALKEGKHVIIDDTNLSDRPVERITQLVQKYRKDSGDVVQIEVIPVEASLEEAIERDNKREKKVGRDVIVRMYKQHMLKDERGPHYAEQDISLPPALICDLDGTLAILGKRSPYEALKCESDILNEPVAEILRTYKAKGEHIILLSGREDNSREATERWLKKHDIPYDALYMRITKDHRKDSIVKKELYVAHILHRYFVRFVLDDRNQVVDLWRLELGLPCLQVNYGDF